MEKHKILVTDLKHIKNKINRLNRNVNKDYGENNDEDSLESYMSDLRNYKTVDKIEIKRLKMKMNELQNEEEKLRKIINIVRPTTLPELLNPQTEDNNSNVEQTIKVNTTNNSQLVTKPTIPEVKKIKSDVQEKEKMVHNEKKSEAVIKEKDVLKEVEEKILRELKEAEKRQKQLEKKDKKIIAKSFEKDVSEDFGNMIWKPPADQTGDGRTNLNDKYGY